MEQRSSTDVGKPTPPLRVQWHERWQRWVIAGANGYLYPSIFRAMAWEDRDNADGFLRGLQTAQRAP